MSRRGAECHVSIDEVVWFLQINYLWNKNLFNILTSKVTEAGICYLILWGFYDWKELKLERKFTQIIAISNKIVGGGCGRPGIYFIPSTVRDVNNNYGVQSTGHGLELCWTESEKKKAMANQLHHKFHSCPPGRDIKLYSMGMEVKVTKKYSTRRICCWTSCPVHVPRISNRSLLFLCYLMQLLSHDSFHFHSNSSLSIGCCWSPEGRRRGEGRIPSGRQSLAFSSHWMRHGTYHSRGEMGRKNIILIGLMVSFERCILWMVDVVLGESVFMSIAQIGGTLLGQFSGR